MFWAFKLSSDADLVFWDTFTKIRQIFIQFSGHTAPDLAPNIRLDCTNTLAYSATKKKDL